MAERIFILDKDRVAESGTHDEFMALNGSYAKLFSRRAKSFVSAPAASDGAPI